MAIREIQNDLGCLMRNGHKQCLFTVFTPTYNRAHLIHRVYESLCSQSLRDFEWLVVDDGSQDDTASLVKVWSLDSTFPIRYIRKDNGGKHTAINLGLARAFGKFFLIADSDDMFAPNALERFKYHWDRIPAIGKEQYSGINCLCKDQHGTLMGDKFPKDVADSSYQEMRYKYKIKGEKWGFYITDILRRYPFPEIEGIRFIPEQIIWGAIGKTYRSRFVNEALRIYYFNDPLNSDQLSKSQMSGQSGKRSEITILTCVANLNNDMSWFRYSPKEFIRYAANYSRHSFHNRRSLYRQLWDLNNYQAKILWMITLPIGLLAYLKDYLTWRAPE